MSAVTSITHEKSKNMLYIVPNEGDTIMTKFIIFVLSGCNEFNIVAKNMDENEVASADIESVTIGKRNS